MTEQQPIPYIPYKSRGIELRIFVNRTSPSSPPWSIPLSANEQKIMGTYTGRLMGENPAEVAQRVVLNPFGTQRVRLNNEVAELLRNASKEKPDKKELISRKAVAKKTAEAVSRRILLPVLGEGVGRALPLVGMAVGLLIAHHEEKNGREESARLERKTIPLDALSLIFPAGALIPSFIGMSMRRTEEEHRVASHRRIIAGSLHIMYDPATYAADIVQTHRDVAREVWRKNPQSAARLVHKYNSWSRTIAEQTDRIRNLSSTIDALQQKRQGLLGRRTLAKLQRERTLLQQKLQAVNPAANDIRNAYVYFQKAGVM